MRELLACCRAAAGGLQLPSVAAPAARGLGAVLCTSDGARDEFAEQSGAAVLKALLEKSEGKALYPQYLLKLFIVACNGAWRREWIHCSCWPQHDEQAAMRVWVNIESLIFTVLAQKRHSNCRFRCGQHCGLRGGSISKERDQQVRFRGRGGACAADRRDAPAWHRSRCLPAHLRGSAQLLNRR